MTICRLATIEEVRGRIETLLFDHWREVAKHKTVAPLFPHWPTYYAAEQAGNLIVVVAESENQIIGYSVYFLTLMIHNVPAVMAKNDILYLAPSRRGGILADRMMDMGEAEASRRGASIIEMRVKAGHDFSPLLIRRGYVETDTTFTKAIH